jgi:L-amino acid N-acyltransferase YncA
MIGGDSDLPPGILERYPATLHLNLLAETRGRGVGRRLFETYIERMRRLGIRGVHAQALSVNAAVAKFNEAVGFRLVASRQFRAYAHLDSQAISVHTWVLPL